MLGAYEPYCEELAAASKQKKKRYFGKRTAYNHLAVLGHLDTLTLDNLHIVQTAEDLVLHLEGGRHGELGALLDLVGLVLERVFGARSTKVDGDGWAAGRVHGERVDDAHTRVAGVAEVIAARQAERLLVTL